MKTNLLTSILLIATCFVSQNIWAYDFSTIILSCTDHGTVVINNDKEFTNDIGEVDINNGAETTFVFKPNTNYQLRKVLINGEDVTSSVNNNQLTTMIPAGSKMNVVFSHMTGDVNGDGMVDISDVVKLVNIILGGSTGEETATTYYWYVGTVQPTAVDDPSAWRTSNTDAGFTATVSLAAGFNWLAYPSTWTYTAKDSSNDDFSFNAFVPASTKTSISGYTLVKSPQLGVGENITITFSK